MLRKLLIWIVVALLPLQGYAAAAMISCGPMHASISAAGKADVDVPHHQTSLEQAPHDHTAHSHPQPSEDPEREPGFGELGKFKCSACASCCTAPAGPAPAQFLIGMPGSHAEAIPFSPISEDSIVPDGLERPPRPNLAEVVA